LQHFEDMIECRVRPDHKGRYVVGSGNINRYQPKETEQPTVNLVTPVAQALDMAKRSSVSNKKRLKRQNEDTLYMEMHYRNVPNKKRLAQAMEEEEDTQRPSRGPPGARLSMRELKDRQ
jgi:hypothetical protein